MSPRAPVLVLAIGNPSRGDDALGPMLGARLEALALANVEVITEYQLQIENALDLVDRDLVIFVDAGHGTPAPFERRRPVPAADFLHSTHALSPEAVLETFRRVQGGEPPQALVLCVRGESFELGQPLSRTALHNLEEAWSALQYEVPDVRLFGSRERAGTEQPNVRHLDLTSKP